MLVIAIIPVFGLRVGETSASALSKTGTARAAYDTLTRGGVPSGVLTPLEVLTRTGSADVAVAHVAVLAGRLGAAVITSDSGDIAKLDPALPILKV